MIFYDGIYRLRGKRDKKSSKTFCNTACSWRLRIIDLSISQPDVKHLRPIVVVATRTEEAIFKTNCAESMGKRICRDFDLDINKILWVEYFPEEPKQMYIAAFKPKYYFGPEIFYSIKWRPILPNELKLIQFFIPEAENIKSDL